MPVRSQTFDSAGPDVRIRGNAYQVLEKYLALARDASAAGDRIAAENFYQHAEHYYRVINANGEHHRQQQQQMHGHGHGQSHPHAQGQNFGHGQDPRAGQPVEGQHQNGGAAGTGPQPGFGAASAQAAPGGSQGSPQAPERQSD